MMKAYLQLLRLPNVITAVADAMAGALIAASAGSMEWLCLPFGLIIISSALMYGGGVALNDVADAEADIKERPERPIPSGKIGRKNAAILSGFLIYSGVMAAGMAGVYSFSTALILALAIVLYNLKLKVIPLAGSLNMGLCRSLNFCLGLSLIGVQMFNYLFLAALPLAHTVAVTLMSQGETTGLSRRRLVLPSLAPCFIIVSLIIMTIQYNRLALDMMFFIILYIAGSALAFVPAILKPGPIVIRSGVKYGILALVLLDAALVGIFAGGIGAFSTLSLVIISWSLSFRFTMT